MRVLHVVTAFPRQPGDVITPWLVETLKRLKQTGIQIEVFTSAYQGLGFQVLFGLPVHRFRYFFGRWENLTHDQAAPDRMRRGFLAKLMAVSYVLCGRTALARLCQSNRYDVVHIHWPFPHAAFAPGARRTGARIICSFYGVELRWVKNRLPIFKPFLRWAIRTADAVTAISTHTANEIRTLVDRPVTIIPFGASVNGADDAPVTKPTDPPIILFVGRLVERKGVRYLIEALSLVRQQTDARLVIVGDGGERPALEAHTRQLGLQDAVTFTGMVSSPVKEDYYRRCRLFVLPAVTDARGDTEGLGTVLLEAMMYRKPVIASETGGITDIVRHEQTGLLVPEKDPAALAAAILRLLTDEQLARQLGEQGYQHCRAQFSWDRIIADLRQLYGSVINPGPEASTGTSRAAETGAAQ